MPNDPESLWRLFVNDGATDRKALFKLFSHYSDMNGNNYQQLRGEVDMLRKRVAALESKT